MDSILEFLHIPTENPWVSGSIEACIIVAGFSALLVFGTRVFRPLIIKLIGRFQARPDEKIVGAFLSFLRKVLVLVGLELTLAALPLPPHIENWAQNTIFVLIAVFILFGLFDVIEVISRLMRVQAKEFEILVNRILKILAFTVVLMVTMRHFNYDIWHIMTALGVGTLAVGLAAQPTLSNMIAGFTILLDRPFRRGDRIFLSGGDTGDVMNIGMRSTHILTPDGNMLIVSNSDLVNTRVINYTFPNAHMNSKLKFYVEKDSPLSHIKDVLKAHVEQTEGIVQSSSTVLITNLNDWGIEITVSFNAQHYANIGKIGDSIMQNALAIFSKENIRIATNPFPVRPSS